MKTQEATAQSKTAQPLEGSDRSRETARASLGGGARAQLSIHELSLGELKGAQTGAQPKDGHLATCAYCDTTGYIEDRWHDIRRPVPAGPSSGFRHTICPTCYETVVKPEVERVYQYLNGPAEEPDYRAGSLQVKTPVDETPKTVPVPA